MKRTKQIFLSPPHIGGEEMSFVQEAFESNYIAPLGPQVDAFEDCKKRGKMPEASYGKCNRWLTVIIIKPEEFGVDSKTVQRALENENIESRPVWKPMHLQSVFDCGAGESIINSTYPMKKRYKARMIGGSVSEELFAHELCLPSGTAMMDHDMDRVVEIILTCRK